MQVKHWKWSSFVIVLLLVARIRASGSSFSDSSSNDSSSTSSEAIATATNIADQIQPPSPKSDSPLVDNVWPEVIMLLDGNYGKELDQIDKTTQSQLKSHLERHFRQSKYLINPLDNLTLSRLEKYIWDFERRLLNALSLYEYFSASQSFFDQQDRDCQPTMNQVCQMVKQEANTQKKTFWSQTHILCVLYMIDESKPLSIFFNNLDECENLESSVKSVLKQYHKASGYQGEELDRRLKILQLALNYVNDYKDKSLESAKTGDISSHETSWQGLMKLLHDNKSNQWTVLDIGKFIQFVKECLDRVSQVDSRLHKRIRELAGRILEVIDSHKKKIEMPERSKTLPQPSTNINVRPFIFLLGGAIRKKSFVLCALYTINESPFLFNDLSKHWNKDVVPKLSLILEKFRQNSGFNGAELDQRTFILQKAFGTRMMFTEELRHCDLWASSSSSSSSSSSIDDDSSSSNSLSSDDSSSDSN